MIRYWGYWVAAGHYETAGELRAAAEGYICAVQGVFKASQSEVGKVVPAPESIGKLPGSTPERLNNAGFALGLGFSSYRDFLAQRSRGPEWAAVVDWAHSAIEHALVIVANNPTHKNVRGVELSLSTHYSYTAKKQVDITGSIQAVMDVITKLVQEMLPQSLREEFMQKLLRGVDQRLAGM